MAEDENPFVTAGRFAAKRLAELPGRVVRLPGQLISEITNAPHVRRGRAAARLQSDLREQITGERIDQPFARDALELVSLGLIPSSPGAELTQEQIQGLSEDQRTQFDQMNPLMRSLLQARRPQDFADIMTNDSLFAERGFVQTDPDKPLRDPGTGELIGEAPRRTATVPAPSRVVDLDTGEQIVAPDRTLQPVSPEADLVDLETGENKRPGKRIFKMGPTDRLVSDDGTTIASAMFPDGLPLSEEERAKLERQRFGDEMKLNTRFDTVTGIDRKRADKMRALSGVFALEDPSRLPEEVVEGLRATIPDLDERNASGLRDIALIFAWLKILDPPSTVREGEKDFVEKAKRVFGNLAEIAVNKALQGESLTDDQRAEILNSIIGSYRNQVSGYEQLLLDYKKIALRSDLDPANAPLDSLKDLREVLTGDARLLADQETVDLLVERYVPEGTPVEEGMEIARKAAARIGLRLE